MAHTNASVARAFPPGDFIREEVRWRSWTPRNMAEILERPIQAVNAIIKGKKEVTPETAVALRGLSAPLPNSGSTWKLPIVWRRSARQIRPSQPVLGNDTEERGSRRERTSMQVPRKNLIATFRQ